MECSQCEGSGELVSRVCGHISGECPCRVEVVRCQECDGTGEVQEEDDEDVDVL